MIVLILVAVIYAFVTFDGSLNEVGQYAQETVVSPLPHWLLAGFNYIGLSMFSGIAMAILIGGSNWNPRVAGWGGFVGGTIFGGLLMLMTAAILISVHSVGDSDLPTLALINNIHPLLGDVAAIATYLMIFSTTLGVFFATGRRVAVLRPARYRPIFIGITLAGFGLSFLPFTQLVNTVFPVLGWLGILFVAVLLGTWLMSGRTEIDDESTRRSRIAALIVRRLTPNRSWTKRHSRVLAENVDETNIPAETLGDDMSDDVYYEIHQTSEITFTQEEQADLGERLADYAEDHGATIKPVEDDESDEGDEGEENK